MATEVALSYIPGNHFGSEVKGLLFDACHTKVLSFDQQEGFGFNLLDELALG